MIAPTERSDTPTVAMPATVRAALATAAVLCIASEVSAICIYTMHFTRWPWPDFMVFYSAARAFLTGNLPVLFDGERFTAYVNHAFAAWLPKPFEYLPWVYPPPFLLLLLPLALLPFAVSCVTFEAATLVGLLAATRAALGRSDRRRALLVGAAVVLSPAAAFNFGTGQNGFLTTALLTGGMAFVDRRPALGGILLGLVSYKPQFWPLATLALVVARRRRALLAMVLTAAVMVLASIAVCGTAPWRVWLAWAVASHSDQYERCCLLFDQSLRASLVVLGASGGVGDTVQAAGLVASAASVWWCYGRPSSPTQLRLVVLLAATALAAPHIENYDAVLLATAGALFFAYGLDHGFAPGGIVAPLLVWTVQVFDPPHVMRIGAVTPLTTALLIAVALARCRAVEVPAGPPAAAVAGGRASG